MIYEVIFFPRAEVEIEDAFYWYESKYPGLGNRFLENFEQEVERITSNPYLFRSSKNDLREAIIQSFPYVIIYSVLDQKILIQAVFNTSRNPTKKP